MSSPYPILDNRPIDQWKVTELKEELKRRRLMTKGLKEDLVKRLDEALRNEMENDKEDDDNGFNCEPQPEVPDMDVENVPIITETANDLVDHGDNKYEKVGDDMDKIDAEAEVSTITLGQGNVQPGEVLSGSESPRVEEVLIVQETTVETSTTVSEVVVSEIVSDLQDIPNSDTREQNGNLNTQLENDDCEPQEENQDLKPPQMDIMLDSSIPTNQVSEASPVLGFQVKSDSISTDSLSINETNELKDNIIADNVKLELEVVKEEIVETSVSNVVPDGGESHPMHDEGPHEESVEVKNKHNAINSDMGKENDTEDVGYSEKLNLDRSSGDDSMEEDVVDNKQIDSKYNSDEVDHKSAQTEVPVIKEEVPVDVATPTEKRKIHDQEAVGNSEASKRQRRWNTQSLTVPKAQSSSPALSTTPKDIFQSPGLKRNFSRSDSSKSEASPKERVVPPSSKPATKSLRIDRFVRPFTLKAVQELLGNTGNVTSFWMDHIKTHCYVTYSSVEEAIETRNAVYNLQWPPNGGLLLVAEFVDPQEVKMRVEPALQIPDSSVSTAPAVHPALPTLKPQPSPSPRQQVLRQPQPQPQPSPREQVLRQALPPPPSLPPPPPLSNPPPVRERLTLPPPPPLPENFDPPIVTLDDLFRKTKATPRIYYLPLSEELVAAKVADRDKNMKQ